MYDLIRKGMLTGIGLALKTWDEVEALAKELEKKGEMPREEGKNIPQRPRGKILGSPVQTGKKSGKKRQ